MLGFVEQSLVSFANLVIVLTAESSWTWSQSAKADETALVRSRLSPAVAALLDNCGVRVIRVLNRSSNMLACTRLVFPRTCIVIDYNVENLSANAEDVIIAHEIAHVRGNHPVLLLGIQCLLAGLAISFALHLAALEPTPLIGLAVLLLVMIPSLCFVVIPLGRTVLRLLEFDADFYAVQHVGLKQTLETLQAVNSTLPNRSFDFMSCRMDDRISRLRRLLTLSLN